MSSITSNTPITFITSNAPIPTMVDITVLFSSPEWLSQPEDLRIKILEHQVIELLTLMETANVEEPDHKFNTDNANDSQADHCQQLLDGISVRRGYSKITGPAQTCTHYVIDGEVVAEDDEDVETAGNDNEACCCHAARDG